MCSFCRDRCSFLYRCWEYFFEWQLQKPQRITLIVVHWWSPSSRGGKSGSTCEWTEDQSHRGHFQPSAVDAWERIPYGISLCMVGNSLSYAYLVFRYKVGRVLKKYSFPFFLVELGFELRVLCLQCRCSTAWVMSPVHFALVILEMKVLWTICLGCPWTIILLVSVSQLARITGVSNLAPCQKKCLFFTVLKSYDPIPHCPYPSLISHPQVLIY
jgi:hypothetical protein